MRNRFKNSLAAILMVLLVALTGCQSDGIAGALDGAVIPQNTAEAQLTETTTAEVTTEQESTTAEASTTQESTTAETTAEQAKLTEADLLMDVSTLPIPDYSGTDFYILNDNVPFFSDVLKNYDGDNFIYLSELDELKRCGTCIGLFSNATLPTEERGEIGHVKPSGWHTVKYDKSVISDLYLYNRCHLLMYAVSGINDDERNLITGTRQFNLDMLELENQVYDLLKYDENAKLLYRVTPLFEGDNLVAKGVLMEAATLGDDDGLSFCMFIYNVQDGIVIDYATGESALVEGAAEAVTEECSEEQTEEVTRYAEETTQYVEETTQQITEAETQTETQPATQQGTVYVANTNTKKFHYPGCSSVNQIKQENRWDYTGSRDELINMGYEPCKRCNP